MLQFQFSVSSTLSQAQIDTTKGLFATKYPPWMNAQFPPGEISSTLHDMVAITSTPPARGTYFTVVLLVPSIYNKTTVAQLRALDNAFFMRGMQYITAPPPRRRLLSDDWPFFFEDITIEDIPLTTCVTTGECSGFFERNPLDECDPTCYPKPCPEGTTGFHGTCDACAANTYKDTIGNATCTPCPQRATTSPGAVSFDACKCPADTFFDGSICMTNTTTTPDPTTTPAPTTTTAQDPITSTPTPALVSVSQSRTPDPSATYTNATSHDPTTSTPAPAPQNKTPKPAVKRTNATGSDSDSSGILIGAIIGVTVVAIPLIALAVRTYALKTRSGAPSAQANAGESLFNGVRLTFAAPQPRRKSERSCV